MSRLLSHFKLTEEAPPPSEAELREARLRAARACQNWTEVENDFVRRGRRWVSASTRQVFKVARGAIFEPGSAGLIASHQPLYFTVDADTGGLAFYEADPLTWTQQLEHRARRRLKRVRR